MLLYRLSVSDAAFEVRIIFKKTLQKYTFFRHQQQFLKKNFLFLLQCSDFQLNKIFSIFLFNFLSKILINFVSLPPKN